MRGLILGRKTVGYFTILFNYGNANIKYSSFYKHVLSCISTVNNKVTKLKTKFTIRQILLAHKKNYMKLKDLFSILTLLCILCFTQHAYSQGVTTARISGKITDSKGAPLANAAVVAVHQPTGTRYGVLTRADGQYNLNNVRIGGPYMIKVSLTSYADQVLDSVSLALDEEYVASFVMVEKANVTEVNITAQRNDVINANRTGASTTIQRAQLEQLPTINRSFADFMRLTPQSGINTTTGQQYFAGRNSGYNNITIDGALFNNSFGLSGTIGGQANSQPISLDAVEQIQVSIAPFDVRQGSFTGAGINAVTRSGTNEFKGSVYDYQRTQALLGDKVGDVTITKQDFSVRQTGFRLGGPIIKNKLFFFVNAEMERRTDPATSYTANKGTSATTAANVSNARASQLDSLRNFLIAKYNYDPGKYENYNLLTHSDKATAKFDWNINEKNHLSVKYNFLKSYRDVPPSNSGSIGGSRQASNTAMPFSASNYRINNNMNSVVLELNTNISNILNNSVTVGYSAFRDFRESTGGIFPTVDIGNGNGASLTTFGYEPFTANNVLNSNVGQISDNLTAYLGKHTVTLGTYNEFYQFKNGFAPNYYGSYQFSSIADFYKSAANAGKTSLTKADSLKANSFNSYKLQYSALPDASFPYAKFSATQLGFYLQDQYNVMKTLRVTAGIRADIPMISSNPQANDAAAALTFRNGAKIDESKVPSTQVLWSPRVGFNWDVKGDKKTQVRGGAGIFTGRVPFVWVSNQFGNNGVLFGSYSVANNSSINKYPFSSSVTQYIPANRAASATYNLAVTDNNFNFPQVWRANLGVDHKMPWGILGTVDGMYSGDLNAVLHQNINLPNSTLTAVGADNRTIYSAATGSVPSTAYRINNNITDAILMTNSSKGYTYSATVQLQKIFSKGLFVSAAYNYAESKDVNSGGSIAQSIWSQRVVVGDPNQNTISYSDYQKRHRVLTAMGYRIEYAKHFATTFSMFYDASPGQSFSYVYAGDMNRDGVSGNDLIYVPRNASEIVLSDIKKGTNTYTKEAQWSDLDAYISQDPYLKNRRGQYAERNGANVPWVHRFDARIMEDIFTNVGGKKNVIQLSLDIFNLGNLISPKFGIVQLPNRSSLITVTGYDAQGRPNFQFPYLDATNFTKLTTSFKDNTDIVSRWQIQFGIRYIFN